MKKYLTKITTWDLLAILVIFGLSYFLSFKTLSYQDGHFYIASRLWSDFGAHIPLIRSFSMGNNFPPEYPTFPGEPIRYHYMFYLLVGLLEKFGLNFALSLNILSFLGLVFLMTMIYKTTELFFKNKKAAFLSVILFMFNGSLTFLQYFKKPNLTVTSLYNDIVHAKHFASFGPWDGKIVSAFWNWNIYTNQRHLAISFALILFILWPALKLLVEKKYVFNKWHLLIFLLFFTFLPLFNQAAYSILLLLLFCLFIFSPNLIKPIGSVYALGTLFSLACFISYPNSANIGLHLGYLSQESDLFSIFYYWLHNIGLYLLLIPILFVFLKTKQRIFLLMGIPIFVIANMFWLSTDIINNHKLINFFIIILNILTAGFITTKLLKNIFTSFIALVLIVGLTLSGIVDAFPIINDNKVLGKLPDYPNRPMSQWIKQQTAPESVFLTTSYLYNPASLVGRKTFLDYGYFNWSMGYEDGERRQLLSNFFDSNIDKLKLCQLLAVSNIDYIYIDSNYGQGSIDQRIDIKNSFINQNFQPIFVSEQGDKIMSVEKNCQSNLWIYQKR